MRDPSRARHRLARKLPRVDDGGAVAMFGEYLQREGTRITRAQFERNLAQKESMPEFLGDILPLLPSGSSYDPAGALRLVRVRLVERLLGRAWQAPEQWET